MTNNYTDEHIQLNLGNEQRNAARDYYEYVVYGSIKQILAMSHRDELDCRALNNGTMFKHRFGFEATDLVRQKIIKLQRTYDIFDGEINRLYRSGNLRITRKNIRIKAYRLEPVLGWVQIFFFFMMSAMVLWHIELSNATIWKKVAGELFITTSLTAGTWLLHQLYIAPWRILSRSGALAINGKEI